MSADKQSHSISCSELTLFRLAVLGLNAIQQRLHIDSKTVEVWPSAHTGRFRKIEAVGRIGNRNVSVDGSVDNGGELIFNKEADIVDNGLILGKDEGRHDIVDEETVRIAGNFDCQRRKIHVDARDDCDTGENRRTNHASRRKPRPAVFLSTLHIDRNAGKKISERKQSK